ncbi:O-linked N-acetylglucosamine transferase family protein [Chromohalobacter israelensis]|uniref:O-linked N-acetylglucosamine transferase family protein n=1 Tax=Chromohalobacter israelensis TaxID=141390 RepID=UPI001CC72E28|nr:tetratricopeptide repeat protein [Chromohalobacter salexigens]MBZ5877009.1 tetratricopeptide repeat protein [Chromohalobacter salexigens]
MSTKRNQRHANTTSALTLTQARKQTQRFPADPDAWLALGRLLAEKKEWAEAKDALEHAQSLRPESADQQALLGHIAYQQNRTQDAIQYLHDALSRAPTLVLGLVTLAKLHIDRRELSRALEYAQQAYEASPQHIPSIETLANALSNLYRYEEALELYCHLTEISPQDFSSWNNAGNMLRDLGRLSESYSYYERAIRLGSHPFPYSNYLTAIHYDPEVSREKIMAFAKSWEERYAPDSHLVPPRPERPKATSAQALRLGLLSDGFRKHPVGKMITLCLEHLPKGQFELYCYTTSDAVDALTTRIQHCAQKWQPIRHLSDEEFTQKVRDDEIDILIDLSGHNTGSRMRAIAMQPAPLIVKWVGGLINTTGVQAIDYLISDHVETPEGEDEYYTEKLIRLPDDYIVFDPPEKLPALSELPAKRNGYITLACFNNPTKLNDITLKQWASIMHELPNSRLLLKGRPYTSENFCERLYATLEAEGIPRERLIIEGPGSNYEMLDAYNRADIALDPWPYSGGLTTCESFIMGVPVVTLPGPTFAGRHSATHLVNAGMPELVANSWEEYRARVIELASDLDSLGTIRQHLRDVLLHSPVCDGPRFAKHFTDAMRAIWQRYCDDKAPAALTFNKEGEARFEDEDAPVKIHYAEAPEDDSTFQWQFDGKLIAVDNGGQLLESDVVRQLLQKEALELIAFDPSSRALDTSLKQHQGVHYYPNATLGDGQPGQLHACLDPKLSASLAPLDDEYQPEAIRKGSQVLTQLPLNTIALDSIQGLPAIDWLVLDDLNDASAILDNGTQALKDTLLLQVKVAFQPTHERQPNLAEIQHWASRNGFRFYRLHEPQHRSHLPKEVPEVHRQATELVSADALLLPSHARMETLSDNQRTRLAFLLHTVFGIGDIAYTLLKEPESKHSYILEKTLQCITGRSIRESLRNIKTEHEAKSTNSLIEHIASWGEGLINSLITECEKCLQKDATNNTAHFVLIHALLSKKTYKYPNKDFDITSFEDRLKKAGWQHKRALYTYWISHITHIKNTRKSSTPSISAIIISNKFKDKLVNNITELRRQSKNLEIVFVNNGAPQKDFKELLSLVDIWIDLKGNSGAYLARNIGSIYANSSTLLFIDDDGIPERNFISAHMQEHTHNEDLISARGRCRTSDGQDPKHYNLGVHKITSPPTLEGNVSIKAPAFFEAGGWGDYILFGHGGYDLCAKLMDTGYKSAQQIYTPYPILWHEYLRNPTHAKEKLAKQKASYYLLNELHRGLDHKVTTQFHKTEHVDKKVMPSRGQDLTPQLSFPKDVEKVVKEEYRKADVILEYGTGGSTLLAAEMHGKTIFGVENDFSWAQNIRNILNKKATPSQPSIHHVDIGNTGKWAKPLDSKEWKNFPDYALSIWEIDSFKHPDVVLVDGRLRTSCLLTVILKAQKETLVLFDDYTDRKHYHIVERLIKPIKIVGRMAIFCIKPEKINIRRQDIEWVVKEFYKVTLAGNDSR